MPGVSDDAQIRLRPGAVQVPCAAQWTDDVIAALHDHTRYISQLVRIVQKLIVALEEAAVHEIVAFDARELQREFGSAGAGDVIRIWQQIARAAFPGRPGFRSSQ